MTLGISFFLAWFSLWLLAKFKPQSSAKHKLLVLLCLLPLMIYPYPYSPVWWLRGLTGDVSMLTLLMLVIAVENQIFAKISIKDQEKQWVMYAVVGVGLVFYPLALGIGSFDPYALGYAHFSLLFVLLMAAAWAVYASFFLMASILLLVLLGWNMQLLQSVNLWDYLIDPFIFFFYAGRMVKCRL